MRYSYDLVSRTGELSKPYFYINCGKIKLLELFYPALFYLVHDK